MRGSCTVLAQLLIAGMLVLAAVAQGASAVPEHGGAGAGIMEMHAGRCCGEAGDLARTMCELPCLCLQALAGAGPELEARSADRFDAPPARRLAERTPDLDPLPPRSPVA